MMRAWHEGGVKGYAGTILRVPFAASEQMMRPILEYLVPRQKLGVFAGMAQHTWNGSARTPISTRCAMPWRARPIRPRTGWGR
jgi:hypothetical protein